MIKKYTTQLMLTFKQADTFVKKYPFYEKGTKRDKLLNTAVFHLLTAKVGTEVKVKTTTTYSTYEFTMPNKIYPVKVMLLKKENPIMAQLLDHFVVKMPKDLKKLTPYVWFRIKCDTFLVDDKGRTIKWFNLFPNTFDPTSDKGYRKGDIYIKRKEGKLFNVSIMNSLIAAVPQHIAEHIFTNPEMYAAICPQNKKEIKDIYITSNKGLGKKILAERQKTRKKKRKRIRVKRKV